MTDVQTEVPFDITLLSVEDLRTAGVVIRGRAVNVEQGTHRAWQPHSGFLADQRREGGRDWDALDRGRARAALLAHARVVTERIASLRARAPAHEDGAAMLREALELERRPLRGLVLERSFPCLGTLRVEDECPRVVQVQCDACGARFGVGRRREDDDEPSRSSDGKDWAVF